MYIGLGFYGESERDREEAWTNAHATCETCKGQMCACRDKCPGDLIEATPETYPGFKSPGPGLRVCVECAPQWEGA